ncbi:hypothetical protein [Hazenella coriacea]|uniref:Prespore-specific regulator n=1 Tax=Hazenella coriacea TaxID=1179467 RepID=A0A4R3L6N7_9BACL|nr:hypothetical protein [Hazenella coriacea]TCS95082.1 prespore-specific regulator [Hazenella coriacea]
MKGRRWTEEEDQLLREEVLQSIRDGGTQLHAFEKVGKQLGRTLGACGFRWNAVLRQQDPHSYKEAKRKRVHQQIQKSRGTSVESFAQIMTLLKQTERNYHDLREDVDRLTHTLSDRTKRYEQLQLENSQLKKEKDSYYLYEKEIKDRYFELVQLLKYMKENEDIQVNEINRKMHSTGIPVEAESDSSS